MIVEERSYRIRNGRMGRYRQLVRDEGLAIQQPILSFLIGDFTTGLGTLSQVTHQAFLPKLSEYIEQAENRIPAPTDFSPLRLPPGFSHQDEETRR